MYKITIIAVGKFKEPSFRELESLYLKMLGPYARVKIIELRESSYLNDAQADKARRLEAEQIEKYLSSEAFIIVLDERGKQMTTQEFARELNRGGSTGQEMVFVMGSSTGLDASLKKRANQTLALSRLTFTHNFVRVLLEEQLYRAVAILARKNYHK